MNDSNELNEEEQKIVDDIMKEAGKEEPKEVKEETTVEVKKESPSKEPSKKTNRVIAFYSRYMFLISVAIAAIFIAISITMEQNDIYFVREIPTLIYAIAAFGMFSSIFRLILKIKNTIARLLVGLLHIGLWVGISLIAYIFLCLMYPSVKTTVSYNGKTYVKEYGFFGSYSYHEKINPIMAKSSSIDSYLAREIEENEYNDK